MGGIKLNPLVVAREEALSSLSLVLEVFVVCVCFVGASSHGVCTCAFVYCSLLAGLHSEPISAPASLCFRCCLPKLAA